MLLLIFLHLPFTGLNLLGRQVVLNSNLAPILRPLFVQRLRYLEVVFIRIVWVLNDGASLLLNVCFAATAGLSLSIIGLITVDRLVLLLMLPLFNHFADLVLHGAHTESELLLLDLPELAPLLQRLLVVLHLLRWQVGLLVCRQRHHLNDFRKLLHKYLVVVGLILVFVATLLTPRFLEFYSLSVTFRSQLLYHLIWRVLIAATINSADSRLLSLDDGHVG